MTETLVRVEGAQEFILGKLVELGIFKTRSEVIRAGILELGKEYGVFANIKDLESELAARKMQKINSEVASGKRRLVKFDDALKELKIKRKDLK
ncbi:MAG: hypothetical protein COT15_00830 [Candidatus Diapherotrites archaeon CG08_land_8_20_14_0_20_34_12]|nr:MAG: hypothetical protein COT15_00830 [Candidatus Diapherotrites archaeon CG08_land_8_20_14_0_20_34_12]